ncbi:putative U3 small nucleolar RNA-associated protein 11 (Utp11) [Monocercomonoides exilis]|uniref:putative U3 small nucleolar RNA-associated protein 11 (Utp11) n=1 Tax=Monocercomonoides exilis TaxID=2049356 RepID=UPI0035593E13|nr:putative U3 small nucleolar RNA-associated protein 11 (Utp11) [Monocercomonoides exilis]|eukprot:MONOS_7383.1-p1 / transcript=MONOS_7383.1 / gene=MONOS_7383 / organism=Monocercomonoides_exilis_PA203 / gene_product=U3 small nucleolar RNA-associated protein 11 (Utp11) / transcript_product=U3 small nucleolar RNA-associated protein 11 (Utp11) / location=Mono_scaffold00250:77268-78127(-) / protein_length=213 / sequence_SO=supercontig / SO=protein_coding / is_pseudo=false
MGLIGGRVHKERPQPQKRKRLGVLEKHKDYVVRARDYHKKRNALKRLKRKAEFKNEDEFYFSMEHLKMDKGIVKDTKESEVGKLRRDPETKRKHKLLFETARNVERKKVERLSSCVPNKVHSQRTIFITEDNPDSDELITPRFTSPLDLTVSESTIHSLQIHKRRLHEVERREHILQNHLLAEEKGRKKKIVTYDDEGRKIVNYESAPVRKR